MLKISSNARIATSGFTSFYCISPSNSPKILLQTNLFVLGFIFGIIRSV